MIPANELRTGNWVMGKPISIPKLGIFSDGKTKITAYGIHAIEACMGGTYEPIPLTPEIMMACGFKSYKETADDGIGDEFEYWIKGWFDVLFDTHGALIIKNYHVNINRPQYLHQLQNIYFSLFGEELEYNPKKR